MEWQSIPALPVGHATGRGVPCGGEDPRESCRFDRKYAFRRARGRHILGAPFSRNRPNRVRRARRRPARRCDLACWHPGSSASRRPLADPMPRPTERPTAYVPGLDGVRALAVAAVVGYHLGVPALGGGLLGVGVFFTLSGFLITGVLVAGWERTRTVGLGRFYVHRARRLLPAVVVVLVVVSFVSVVTHPDAAGERLTESVAALLYVSNWEDDLGRRIDFERFSGPGPFDYLWFLAVEEQFYVVWPVLMLGLLVAAGSARGVASTDDGARPRVVRAPLAPRRAGLRQHAGLRGHRRAGRRTPRRRSRGRRLASRRTATTARAEGPSGSRRRRRRLSRRRPRPHDAHGRVLAVALPRWTAAAVPRHGRPRRGRVAPAVTTRPPARGPARAGSASARTASTPHLPVVALTGPDVLRGHHGLRGALQSG